MKKPLKRFEWNLIVLIAAALLILGIIKNNLVLVFIALILGLLLKDRIPPEIEILIRSKKRHKIS